MGTAQPFAHQSIIFETSYGPVGKSQTAKLEIGAPTIHERTPLKENSEMGNFDVSKMYQETGSHGQNYPRALLTHRFSSEHF